MYKGICKKGKGRTSATPIVLITTTIVLFIAAISILIRATFTSRERAQEAGEKVVNIARELQSQRGCVPDTIESEAVKHLGGPLYAIDEYTILYKVTSDTSFTVCVVIDDTEQTTYESTTGTWK